MNDQDLIEASYDLYRNARAAMEANRFDDAIDLFTQSIALKPHFKSLELLGECLLHVNRSKQAIVYLAAAAGLGNNAFRARYLLAKALTNVRETQKAINKLEEALAINKEYKAARDLLAALQKDLPSEPTDL